MMLYTNELVCRYRALRRVGAVLWRYKQKKARRGALLRPHGGRTGCASARTPTQGSLEVIYTRGVRVAWRLVLEVERFMAALNIAIHDSSGSRETIREASCGTSPANSAERNIQRHGRLHTKHAPTAAAATTSAIGLCCAKGFTTAVDASLATCATGRNG